MDGIAALLTERRPFARAERRARNAGPSIASWFERVGVAIGLSLLTACSNPCDKEQLDISGLQTQLTVQQSLARMNPGGGHLAPQAVVPEERFASAAPAPPQRVRVKALNPLDESFVTFPNKSYGKFVAQVTVSVPALTGLTDGSSMGFLEYRQAKAADAPRRFYIAAQYDAAIDGLRAVVADPVNPGDLGTPIEFAGLYEIDLRIEQTDTDVVLSARATPANQGAGGWTVVYTVARPLDPAFYHVYIGARNLQKGGAFDFTHFAIEGDGVGGPNEYPVIAQARVAAMSIRAAHAKLTAAPQDVAGADGDLDTALASSADAISKLQIVQDVAQRPPYARLALSTLRKAQAGLSGASTAVKSHNAQKIQGQVGKLEPLAVSYTKAMGNLLGWSVPRLATKPELFSLNIP